MVEFVRPGVTVDHGEAVFWVLEAVPADKLCQPWIQSVEAADGVVIERPRTDLQSGFAEALSGLHLILLDAVHQGGHIHEAEAGHLEPGVTAGQPDVLDGGVNLGGGTGDTGLQGHQPGAGG